MPLPAALAARLAKRGLLKETPIEPPVDPVAAAIAEEVIAEDYDDDEHFHPDDAPYDPETLLTDGTHDSSHDAPLCHETVACPNKTNAYHECVAYCMQRWGPKAFQHNPALNRKHERLLQRYPVPLGFVEVGDPDTGRYYYWNTETDEVSWLPPQHPRAKICLPAERLRELVQKSEKTLVRTDHDDSEGESEDDSTDLDDEDDLNEDQDFEHLEKEVLKRKKQSEEDRGVSKKRRDAKLDPMDPASYSDIPKGNWSSGLEKSGTAKTGVDVTATGPLFQQRPYPSPGAVLRMNDKK